MPDYSKGKIYKIVVKNDPDAPCYVGSTISALYDRFSHHKAIAINPKYTRHCKSKQLFDEYGINNCEIQLVEDYSCKTKQELLQRENEWMNKLNCINRYKAFSSVEDRKEYKKSYYEEHKDEIIAKERLRYATKKDEISQKVKEKRLSRTEEKKKFDFERKKKYRLENSEMLKEQKRLYYESNRETIKQRKRDEYQNNKEKFKEERKQKVDCQCGAKVSKSGLSKHKKTEKHQLWLASQSTPLPKPKLKLKLSLKTDAN